MGNRSRATAAFAALLAGLLITPCLRAQAPAGSPSTPQPTAVPQWQIDAGGKRVFDVASVKPNKSGDQFSDLNIPIGPGDAFAPTGGLYSGTNVRLISYIYFAYQLTGNQLMSLLSSELPRWVTTDRFDIQARGEGNPTKDQMRLMLQSLLEDRFKLKIHYEIRSLPVLALGLTKPGKTGPQLQAHPDDASCPSPSEADLTPGSSATVEGGFPAVCGALIGMPASVPGLQRVGARNVPFGLIVTTLTQIGGLDRSVVDRTGLSGKFDFMIEFASQPNGPAPLDSHPDTTGTTFLQALKEQLGLKLESATGPVEVFVIDHIEQPSEN